MSSKRSSSKVFVIQGSPRTSSSSLSSRTSSSKSSASSTYTSSNYGYYESSTASDMGRSSNEDSRPRKSFLRVPDPARKAHSTDICLPHANITPVTALKDGITTTTRGKVEVTQHEKRHEERYEPRSSDAKSSDYHKPSSSRQHKK